MADTLLRTRTQRQTLTQLYLQLKTPCKIISHLLDHPQTLDCTRSALRHPEQSKLDYDMAWQQQPNHYIIHRDSPFYPELLQQIATPHPFCTCKETQTCSQPRKLRSLAAARRLLSGSTTQLSSHMN